MTSCLPDSTSAPYNPTNFSQKFQSHALLEEIVWPWRFLVKERGQLEMLEANLSLKTKISENIFTKIGSNIVTSRLTEQLSSTSAAPTSDDDYHLNHTYQHSQLLITNTQLQIHKYTNT